MWHRSSAGDAEEEKELPAVVVVESEFSLSQAELTHDRLASDRIHRILSDQNSIRILSEFKKKLSDLKGTFCRVSTTRGGRAVGRTGGRSDTNMAPK